MARTIAIDSVQSLRLQIMRNGGGAIEIFAEYTLNAGTQVVQLAQKDLTARLNSARKTEAQAFYDAIARDLAAIELA